MRIDRLFQVLVLGGAAMGLAACDDGNGGAKEGGGGAGENGGAGATGGGDSGGGGAATTGATSTSGNGGTGGAQTTGEGGAGTGGTGTGGGLVCSEVPDPGDACGCPCCWVADCSNTEPCCESFCEIGNGGLGCCGG